MVGDVEGDRGRCMGNFELTGEQEALLGHDPSSHGRVLAGPGTGKSITAMTWIGRLLDDRPDLSCKLLTFTRAATAEFEQKLADAGLIDHAPAPATVHSHALSLLMRMNGHDLPAPVRIADDWERDQLIYEDLARRLVARGFARDKRLVRKLEREMAAGWESLDPTKRLLSDLEPGLRPAFVGLWRQHRAAFGYTLLAELPYRAGMALQDLGSDLDALVDLLLVDEYQDLNLADIRMIKALAELGAAVVAIGDDDQSIYGWRYAAPHGIREFLTAFDTDCDYPLSISHRCSRAILAAATELIESTPDTSRAIKPQLRPRHDAPDGTFAYLRFRTTNAEATGVGAIIEARRRAGVDLDQILVLVRSQADTWTRILNDVLEQHDLSVVATGWVGEALANEELRRAIALGRLVGHATDSLAWWTLTEGLTSGLGKAFTNYVYERRELAETWGQALLRLHTQDYPEQRTGARRLACDVVETTQVHLGEIPEQLGPDSELGWADWLLDNLDPDGLSDEASKLLELVGPAIDPGEGLAYFLNHLEVVGKEMAQQTSEGVQLMPMGRSKGLTVDTTIVMGVEEGIVPLERPEDPPDVDEERRLLYVAMTRARSMCVLTCVERRTGPLARIGAPRVGAARGRSPLLADLSIGQPMNGISFARELLNATTEATA